MKMQFLSMTVGGVYEKARKTPAVLDALLSVSAKTSVCNRSGSGHGTKKPESYWLASFIHSAIDKEIFYPKSTILSSFNHP